MASRTYWENAKSRAMSRAAIMRDRQPWTCIIDPALALSRYGVPLVKQLGEVMELWVVRELWHILDNCAFYLQQPGLIAPRGNSCERTPQQERNALEETLRSLLEWERFRGETDLAGLNFFWLGDSPSESFVPKSRNLDIFWRWEAIANSLDSQLDRWQTVDYILPLAFRDTAALAVSLGSAFILTHQLPADFEQNLAPEICNALENWGIPCQLLTPDDSIVAMERDYLRQLLIHTDAAKFLWAGVRLAMLHLIVPIAPDLQKFPEQSQTNSPSVAAEPTDDPKPHNFSWIGARGFWYLI
jgi:hypothetical protein